MSTPTHRFHTVFFDLDGTLLDHFTAIHRAHCHTRRHFGLSEPTMEQVHRAVGAGLDVALERIFAHDRPDLAAPALPVYKAFWDQDENLFAGAELFPGARGLLVALNHEGVRCAVLTNKIGVSSRRICAHLGVTHLLDGIFGANDTPWLKPRREFTAHALTALGVDASDAAALAGVCMIGDSIYDVQTGKNAGMRVFCVTTGTHSADELRAEGACGVYPDMRALGRDVFGVTLP